MHHYNNFDLVYDPPENLLPEKSHPNYKLWRNYVRYAGHRGELVATILAGFTSFENINILDIGCGVGGATIALAQRGARITAIDPEPDKIKFLNSISARKQMTIQTLNCSFEEFSHNDIKFDAVVLQDVIEHVLDPEKFMQKLVRYLQPGGIVYISTPNRWSPVNVIADPHWHLPVVSMLNRHQVKWFIRHIARRESGIRPDLPALLSLTGLRALLDSAGLIMLFQNVKVIKLVIDNPLYVMNAPMHLRLMQWAKKLAFEKLIVKIVNDRPGLFNHFVNPTWFIIARKLCQ